MIEKIGGVCLDDTYYPNKDFYSDGDIEEELLSIVKEHTAEECVRIAEERKNWPLFYHLSPIRRNIINWYPMRKNASVLEIGSGCGAVTGILADKAGRVTCIELSKRRSMINAYQNKDKTNVTVLLGNFETIEENLTEQYDYITLIGVLEYGASYISSEEPYTDFLKRVQRRLKPDGRLLIAIENKTGLKYWAGCREDHTGRSFEGIEGYPNAKHVRTFSNNELTKMLHECGYPEVKFYYPYPDYKFPLKVYSDNALPEKGELHYNRCQMDADRYVIFDETRVYDEILTDEMFPFFSNSFFVEAALVETEWVRPDIENDVEKEYGSMMKLAHVGDEVETLAQKAMQADELARRVAELEAELAAERARASKDEEAAKREDERKQEKRSFIRRQLARVKRKLMG